MSRSSTVRCRGCISSTCSSARSCTRCFRLSSTIEHEVISADLVIGAVLVPGGAAPKLVQPRNGPGDAAGFGDRRHLDRSGRLYRDQPTDHAAEPTYVVDGVIHFCVTNMPGAVARTSAVALNNATLPFVLAIADHGWRRASPRMPHLRHGLNACHGELTHPAVAHDLGLALMPAERALAVGIKIFAQCGTGDLMNTHRAFRLRADLSGCNPVPI